MLTGGLYKTEVPILLETLPYLATWIPLQNLFLQSLKWHSMFLHSTKFDAYYGNFLHHGKYDEDLLLSAKSQKLIRFQENSWDISLSNQMTWG
jgi:hypothetical protein